MTSVESANSATTRFQSRATTPFAHSSQSSITTHSTGFTKKASFASIRNAFKSGKTTEAPPVPQVDYQANYIMKSPFNRSTSSLSSNPPMPLSSRTGFSPPNSGSTATSPPFNFGRSPTPGSADMRYTRGNSSFKAKSHSYAKSYHSHSGSIFDGSDGQGPQFGSSPPPVPRVPNGFADFARSETPPIADLDDDKVVMDPKTPSGYALHAVFMRFAASAEEKIDTFLRQVLEREPLLPDFMGPGIDKNFDDTLQSLGKIAQKHTKPVVNAIMRWRRDQLENVGSDIIRFHMAQSPGPSRVIRTPDVPGLLNERKSLASIYIMCRTLIAVLQSLSKDALGDAMGYSLETTTFEQFKKPDLKLLAQSANHRTNADLYATLLGHLANVR